MRRSKRYMAAIKTIDGNRTYGIPEAVTLLKKSQGPKFDETFEVVFLLGLNPKQADQLVRGSFALPHGIGKGRKVIAFAEGKKAEEAKAAGADEVGSADLAQKILDGWTDFDVAVATPDMMRFVGKLGRVLGPQGKMPSPKSGTVTVDISTAVKEFKAGRIEFRMDAGCNVHAPIGKRSFSEQALADNLTAFYDHLKAIRPATAKGNYILRAYLSTTMGPSVPLVVQ